MSNDILKSSLNEAENRLALAEGDLEAAMNALQPTPRAQKTIAGQVLEEAFMKLRATRAEVKRLAKLLEGGEAALTQLIEDEAAEREAAEGKAADAGATDSKAADAGATDSKAADSKAAG
jgi:hypothetical protein